MNNPTSDDGDLTLHRAYRSGYWALFSEYVRLSYRNYEDPRYDAFGKNTFRIVRNKR